MLDPALTRPQDPASINSLLHELTNATGKGKRAGFLAKKTTFDVEGTHLSVNSWKFREWDYKRRDLPTYARGLFTRRDEVTGNHEIVTRGYDKFFNVDEVPQTKWRWIEENTKAPYDLTLKENGCIIFISGLPDGTLLVCSKHSTGSRGDTELSHAMWGEKWIDKQLAGLGKSKEDLAAALREANATAVAELCDDSFEEHILDYKGDRAGLYLHGINLNLPEFVTYPIDAVDKFAEAWGFKKIKFTTMNDVTSLRKFLEEAAETGSWEGTDVEGFVIRCKARSGPNANDWHDWFFKYKFDEPYLMYRQWRECTKSMINGKEPKIRNHKAITKEYLKFAQAYFARNPGAADAYQRNHGIIKLRNMFLEQRGLKGSDIIKMEEANETTMAEVDSNVVLVPVATIGCGKTTVALGLVKLFSWGHCQNDNISAKGGKPQLFAKACLMELNNHPVVIADRNNHMHREREQIINDMRKARPDTQFVALHYVHKNGRDDEIRKATQERVFTRGDNHQTIQAGTESKTNIVSIMEGFMHRFQPVNPDSPPDDNFDLVINLDPTLDSRTNLEKVVTELHQAYPKLVPNLPAPEAYNSAIQEALDDYQPDLRHKIKGKGNQSAGAQRKPKPKPVEYFALTLPADKIKGALEQAFSSTTPENAEFFSHLKQNNQVQSEFHVTLVHRSQQKQQLWKKYGDMLEANTGGPMGSAEVKLEKVVWDDRVMACVAKILTDGVETANEFAHITVGTASKDIKPKESNDMLAGKWAQGRGTNELDLGGVTLEANIKAVFSR